MNIIASVGIAVAVVIVIMGVSFYPQKKINYEYATERNSQSGHPSMGWGGKSKRSKRSKKNKTKKYY